MSTNNINFDQRPNDTITCYIKKLGFNFEYRNGDRFVILKTLDHANFCIAFTLNS
jgi:hypothetical protein